jgi:hypothetical protein
VAGSVTSIQGDEARPVRRYAASAHELVTTQCLVSLGKLAGAERRACRACYRAGFWTTLALAVDDAGVAPGSRSGNRQSSDGHTRYPWVTKIPRPAGSTREERQGKRW